MAADDEKAVIKQLLDADDDGKLTLEDAKAIAAKMAASARKRLVTLLDEDGDGEISWDEIQGGARGAFHRCEEALTRAWRVLAPHKTKLLAGAGVISCFHGANFKYTILFSGSFATTAWPRVKPALTALTASYKAGKREFAANAPQLAAARDTLKRCSRELEACKDDDAARARIIKEAAHAALLLRKTSTSLFAAIDGPKCASASELIHAPSPRRVDRAPDRPFPPQITRGLQGGLLGHLRRVCGGAVLDCCESGSRNGARNKTCQRR